jgi:hypothetical protein
MLAYYAYVYRVLTMPPDFERSTHPDRLRHGGFSIGFNPFTAPNFTQPSGGEMLKAYTSHAIASAFRAAITAWYAGYAKDYARPDALLFAEKNDNLSREVIDFTDTAFDSVRHIFLVRDPRDRFCSHRRYFERDAATTIPEIIQATARQLENWEQGDRPDRITLRYEDIAKRESAELARLSRFLGVEIPTFAVEFMDGHSTAGSVDRSIGRWRTDMTAEERKALLVPEVRRAIEVFGYSPD